MVGTGTAGTGNFNTGGLVTNVAQLSVSGYATLGGNVTTSGTQTYSGNVVMKSAATNLSSITAPGAGADITIFPNFGGRFSFSQTECLEIRDAAIAPLGEIAPAWISPGGGMSIDRIPEMIDFYGKDTALLIGGALHRGSLRENAQKMAEVVSRY